LYSKRKKKPRRPGKEGHPSEQPEYFQKKNGRSLLRPKIYHGEAGDVNGRDTRRARSLIKPDVAKRKRRD
jgi:hypothetical protein